MVYITHQTRLIVWQGFIVPIHIDAECRIESAKAEPEPTVTQVGTHKFAGLFNM